MLAPEELVGVHTRGQTWRWLKRIYIQMDNVRYREGMTASYAALFTTFPTLHAIDLHCKDLHRRLEPGGKEFNVAAKPLEWKEAQWLDGDR